MLSCRGEPCSPVRVHCTRLHAMRAKLIHSSCYIKAICMNIKFYQAGERGSPLQVIHSFNCIKSYVNKQIVSSKRASNERPYRLMQMVARLQINLKVMAEIICQ